MHSRTSSGYAGGGAVELIKQIVPQFTSVPVPQQTGGLVTEDNGHLGEKTWL